MLFMLLLLLLLSLHLTKIISRDIAEIKWSKKIKKYQSTETTCHILISVQSTLNMIILQAFTFATTLTTE